MNIISTLVLLPKEGNILRFSETCLALASHHYGCIMWIPMSVWWWVQLVCGCMVTLLEVSIEYMVVWSSADVLKGMFAFLYLSSASFTYPTYILFTHFITPSLYIYFSIYMSELGCGCCVALNMWPKWGTECVGVVCMWTECGCDVDCRVLQYVCVYP